MDPQQVWADKLDALERKQWDNAKELADALYGWMNKGGFPPLTIGDASLGKNWHKTIVSFTFMAVANRVDKIRKRRSRRQSAKGGD